MAPGLSCWVVVILLGASLVAGEQAVPGIYIVDAVNVDAPSFRGFLPGGAQLSHFIGGNLSTWTSRSSPPSPALRDDATREPKGKTPPLALKALADGGDVVAEDPVGEVAEIGEFRLIDILDLLGLLPPSEVLDQVRAEEEDLVRRGFPVERAASNQALGRALEETASEEALLDSRGSTPGLPPGSEGDLYPEWAWELGLLAIATNIICIFIMALGCL